MSRSSSCISDGSVTPVTTPLASPQESPLLRPAAWGHPQKPDIWTLALPSTGSSVSISTLLSSHQASPQESPFPFPQSASQDLWALERFDHLADSKGSLNSALSTFISPFPEGHRPPAVLPDSGLVSGAVDSGRAGVFPVPPTSASGTGSYPEGRTAEDVNTVLAAFMAASDRPCHSDDPEQSQGHGWRP